MTAQQLKNSILQMAVQGKLVPQDPNDEPASVLLERIRAEKERLIKEKKIKREKNPSVIFKGADNTPYEKIGDEVRSLVDLEPFEIPSSWEWCRVGDLFSNMSGLSYKKDTLAIKTDKMVRVLRGGNIGEEQFCFKNDDVFISSELVKPELYLRKNYMITPAVSSLDHIGKIALIDKDYSDTVVGGFVLMLIPHFNDDVVSQYLLYAFAAKHHRDNCRNITHKSGQAFYNLSREQMMNLPVPIPPREEMERITAMLKRVLPKVADYAVVDIELQKLNSSFPEALKKSILQEAVQGKLVPQAPSDEPAEALLKRIRVEKQRLIKEGKIKKNKHESVIFRRDNSHYEKRGSEEVCIDDEIPFEIPENWAWCRASSLGTMNRGRGIKRTETVAQGCPCIRYGEIYTTYETSFDSAVSFVPDTLDKDCLHFSSGDVVFTLTGENKVDIAKTVAFLGDGQIAAGGDLAFWTHHGMNPLYLVYYMASPYCIELKRRTATGDIIVHISTSKVGDFLVPVPPIKEQNRIVSAIEQLFAVASTL